MTKVLFPMAMMALSVLLAATAARAQGSSSDLMCRNRAKEIALQTYNNCVTEEKGARLQDLKSRYKSRMSEVQSEFQRELDEINGKKAAASAEASAAKAGTTTATKAASAAPVQAAAAGKVEAQNLSAGSSVPTTTVRVSKPGRAEQPVAGVAKRLPEKQISAAAQPAAPKTINADTAVTMAPEQSASDDIAAAQAEELE